MSEGSLTRRRRFLQSATAGATALLAGCAGLGSQDQSNGSDNGSVDDTDGDNRDDDGSSGPGGDEQQVGVVATLGPQEQQSLRQLQVQLRQGEIDEAEFDQQLTALVEPILESLSDAIEAETGGSVVQMLPTSGAVRVNGPAAELIDVLQLDGADALVAGGDLGQTAEPAP
jgi:hypothetical protein